MSASGDYILETKNLVKEFKGFVAVNDVGLKVRRGSIHALIGPNGAGKTTCFNLLTKFLVPTRGSIHFNGTDITSEQPAQIARRGIIRSFQISAVFPHLTVLENAIKAPMVVKKMTRSQAEAIAVPLLEKVGLKAQLLSYPSQISGGQQQRAAIARALAMEPEAILFDEPTSSLDPEMVKEVLNVMKGLAHTGITMVVVTHEMGFARKVAHRVVFMDRGEIVEDAPKEEFFGKPRSERAQLFLSKILQH